MASKEITSYADHPIVEAAKASLNPMSVAVNGALVGAGAVNAIAGGALARKVIPAVEHFANGGPWKEALTDFGGSIPLNVAGVAIAYKAKDAGTAATVGGLLVAGSVIGSVAAPLAPRVIAEVDKLTTKIVGFFGRKPAASSPTDTSAKNVNAPPANGTPTGPTLTGQSTGTVGGSFYELNPGGGSFYDVVPPAGGGSRFALKNRYPNSAM